MRHLALFFVGYNLVLAGAILGPLTSNVAPPQRTVNLSNGDFSPVSILIGTTYETFKVSKPFHASRGEMIATHMEVWATSNTTHEIIYSEYGPSVESGPCGNCEVSLGMLNVYGQPQIPLATNFAASPYYDVKYASADYALLFDSPLFLSHYALNSCQSNCTAGISGSLTIATPQATPFYAYLPIPLVGGGLVFVGFSGFLHLKQGRRSGTAPR